jgi:hypothetical protein
MEKITGGEEIGDLLPESTTIISAERQQQEQEQQMQEVLQRISSAHETGRQKLQLDLEMQQAKQRQILQRKRGTAMLQK